MLWLVGDSRIRERRLLLTSIKFMDDERHPLKKV